MPVEFTNALSPVMQQVADCRGHVKKCEHDVEEKKTALKASKIALEEAQGALNLAVDESINVARQPTLFDPFGKGGTSDGPSDDGGGSGGGGGSSPDSPAPTPAPSGTGIVLVVEAVNSHPWSSEEAASLPQLPAANSDASANADLDPTREPSMGSTVNILDHNDFTDDRTGTWECRLEALKLRGKLDGRDRLMMKNIENYRGRQESGEAQSTWGKWSEFNVSLAMQNGKEEIVTVLYKPDWKEGVSDHIEAWSESLSATGYWSQEVSLVKGKRPKLPLAEWCREWVQTRYEAYQAESGINKMPRSKSKKGAA